ncbi:MAG: MCE family protein [Marmoricola sp.]
MIISALIRKQLIAFTVASVVGIVVLSVVFLRIPETLGWGRYDITADFAQGAGLYQGSQVNFRGTPVGKVTGMKLTDQGIAVRMSLKNSAHIPSDVRAEIHSVSAVGEQYVELVPGSADTTASGADLRPGAVIGVDRTSSPVEIGPVLDNVAKLVDSLPRKQLTELLAQTSTALAGRDQDLQSILDGSKEFLGAADAAYPQTRALITDAQPLLTTLNGAGGHIAALSRQLASVTGQLRAGDADLKKLLATGPGATGETTSFLQDVGPLLPGFLAPLDGISGTLATYRAYLAQVLSDYPAALSYVQSVTLPDRNLNAVRLTVANADKPPECIKGFLPVSKWRMPDDVGMAYTPLYYCKAPTDDAKAVRGARNVPCPNDPARREPTAALCQK